MFTMQTDFPVFAVVFKLAVMQVCTGCTGKKSEMLSLILKTAVRILKHRKTWDVLKQQFDFEFHMKQESRTKL